MKTLITLLTSTVCGAVILTSSINAEEHDTVKCDPVFKKVETEAAADPDKVLMIVEENTRASEECVCEIIKAAVKGTQADVALTKQIMLTALNVAPQKAKVIEICIAAIEGERNRVTYSGKDVQEVVAYTGKDIVEVTSSGKDVIDPVPAMMSVSGDDDYRVLPPDIRGVYLIQPSAGGVFFNDPRTEIVYVERRPRVIVRRNPPTNSIPQSPSTASIAAQ